MNEQQVKEMYMEYQMIEQHTKQMQQQLEAVTQQLIDMTVTLNSLDEFGKTQPGKEIYVPISAGIFAKASLKKTDELLVNVGSGVAVAKDIPSTKELISAQRHELQSLQKRMVEELEKLALKASEIESKVQAAQSK